jgi:glycosyltransferase involved in cell wall biosynthesis
MDRVPVIAFVSDAILPYHHGGKELRIHEMTHRIATSAEVHVYTMKWWDGPRVRREGGITYHAVSRRFPLYVKDRRSLSQAALFACACLRLLTSRFDVLEADHIPYAQLFVLRLVTRVRGKRLVATWHEVWGRKYWCEYLGRMGVLAWWAEWLAVRMPDRIIAVSPETAERLRGIAGPRTAITVAPNGVDLEAIAAVPADPIGTDLVVVGRLLSHKRIDLLLEAIALLHVQGSPVTCRVIGDGPERASLHERAQALGVAAAVEFRHDVVEEKEVYALVKSARVFAFPSSREGFGLAVLEALACGLPVVTTSAPDNMARHLVTRSRRGAICEPTAVAFATALKDALARFPAAFDGDKEPEAWLTEYNADAMAARVREALLS